ncbi:MAG TPA: ATP-binding protein, partial [Actinomycetes bacterium]|nr:ATP-binding protein [Actinomycetes bacterium]
MRLKLTLLYGGVFLLAGAGLLAVNYALVRSQLNLPFKTRIEGPESARRQLPDVLRQGPLGVVVRVTPDGEQLVASADTPAAIEAARSELATIRRKLETAALNQLLAQSGIALAVMAVVSIGLGWLVAGRVLRPLSAITATARRLEGSTLHERINLQGPQDELKELADTFDQMLGRLDAAFETQRRFVANASHELRTPLAIARTEVDVALADPATGPAELRAMAERVLEANQRSERLIEGLLTLARSERQLRAAEPVDLAVAAADALELAAPEVERLGLRVSRVLGAAPVAGDRALLERLVANLVENAVRHNEPGGRVEVDTGRAGPLAVVRVANSGPPIPPDRVDALFEPFRRLHPDRTGSDRGAGLGLSIVRSVATAHGGHTTANALPDGGLEVTVAVPAGPADRLPTASGAGGRALGEVWGGGLPP